MLSRLKQIYSLRCLAFVADDYRKSIRFKLGSIETDSGTLHSSLKTEESVRYIEEVFADYRYYAEVNRFHGRIAEVGPGDNCGVGLLFLADGCTHADLVDRFYSTRNMAWQAAIYECLLERHPGLQQRLKGVNLADESQFPGVTRYYGQSASAEDYFAQHRGYDAIVSRAVMEHVIDPVLSVERMAAALNPGGVMMHKVDLRDHGLFSTHHHELKFLEIPEWFYRRMVSASGRPNRFLTHTYRQVLVRLNLPHSLLVTRLAGVGEVTPHLPFAEIPKDLQQRSLDYVRSVRHKFCRTLREVSDEDLCVAGLFLVARKPSG